MRDLSRRARVLMAGGVIGVLGAGITGALVIPTAAQATSAPRAQASGEPLVSVCLTIREIHFGPACVAI